MRNYAASLGLVTLLFASAACDGDMKEPRVTNPTPLATMGVSRNVSVQPSILTAQAVRQPSCPLVPPFVGSLGVEIQAVDFPLSLSRVHMTFTDSAGLSAPTVTLPAPVLTRQFGSTLVEARSRRIFPFTFPFGCDARPPGRLVVVVVISDRAGRETTTEIPVRVR